MKEHESKTTHQHDVVEHYQEEGPITVETLDVTSHGSHSHAKAEKKTRLTTPVAIILAAVILGISHLGYGALVGGTSPSAPLTTFKGKTVDASDLATGNTKSKVIVMEYSDTECPFCAQLQPTIKQLKEEYQDKVSFVYRYFPLTQIHPNAFEEARAVFCVGTIAGSEKRAEYIDMLFSEKMSKKNMTLQTGTKERFAKNLGIDEKTFSGCMSDQVSSDAINASIQDGVAAGVQGTPATFVLIKNKKGYDVVSLVDGARPYEYIKAVIDEALTR